MPKKPRKQTGQPVRGARLHLKDPGERANNRQNDRDASRLIDCHFKGCRVELSRAARRLSIKGNSNLAGCAEFHKLSGFGVPWGDAAMKNLPTLRFVKTFLVAALAASVPLLPALARQLHIVVLGDNNIRGKGVALHDAYPAQLERALRARGVDVTVSNAGRDSDTTTGVMARLDSSVPTGTDVAIISVGVNDVVIHPWSSQCA
jgi:hypothetical protein